LKRVDNGGNAALSNADVYSVHATPLNVKKACQKDKKRRSKNERNIREARITRAVVLAATTTLIAVGWTNIGACTTKRTANIVQSARIT
jgi:anti-sigma factor RsiW